MGKWKGITAEELETLRQIEAINYKIREVARVFGKESRLYKQYEWAFFPKKSSKRGRYGLGQAMMAAENKSGIIQLKTGKSFVRQYVITSYTRELKRLSKMKSVGQEKAEMIAAYEARHKTKVKTRSDKAAALRELQEQRSLFQEINDLASTYYEMEKKLAPGMRFASHRKLEQLSKGYWTDEKDLKKMIKVLKKEIAAENHKVVKDFLEGL